MKKKIYSKSEVVNTVKACESDASAEVLVRGFGVSKGKSCTDLSLEESKSADTKAIEEKALNCFKNFIEDSKVISQFLKEDDKEPCWDGHLYLYAEGGRDRDHLRGRVPVQIKGTIVKKIIADKWKYRLEKADLKAYLHEPTFFIVCQIKEDSKERKLFYRELLPDLVNTLLKDMGENDSRKTLFHPLTENLKEFEEQLMVFMSNSKKMVSFADTAPLSMENAVKQGIKTFSFIAPAKFLDKLKLVKYLSTHDTYLYAQISKEYNINMPLSGGPVRFVFKKHSDDDVKVGGRVFYKGYESVIKDGRVITTIANVMTINLPLDDTTGKSSPIINVTTKAKLLKDAINEAEFILAINDVGTLSLGTLDLKLAINEQHYVEDMRKNLIIMKKLDDVLNKLHVTKSLDLTSISDNQTDMIDMLINSVGKGRMVKLPETQSTLLFVEFGNLKLLLWCVVGEDGLCKVGDYFDKTIEISYKVNGKDNVKVSPFSYLQNEKLWETIDNIDYDSLVTSAQAAANEHEACYQMSNYDVLSMISASDAVKSFDEERSVKLLDEALKLNEWLIGNDSRKDMMQVHVINKMQILKRQRVLYEEEKIEVEQMIDNNDLINPINAAIYLLLDKHKEFETIFASLSEDDKKQLREYPIWHLYKETA